jgi:hypothetical protein
MASTKCCRCVCGRISAVSIPLVEIRRHMKIGFFFSGSKGEGKNTRYRSQLWLWQVRPTNELPYTKERKARHKCVNMSVKDREGIARCEGWSTASSDRRAERSVKRIKGRARKGVGEDNGANGDGGQ